jgi:hypothetical protein
MARDDDAPGRAPISLAAARRRQRAERRTAEGADTADEIGPNDLIVCASDLPKTARDVRDRLAALLELFERSGAPVRVYIDADDRLAMITLTEFDIVNLVHENFRVRLWKPAKDGDDGKLIPVTLPQRVARLYLSMVGYFELRPLVGITEAPLLADDGGIIIGGTS